ncbi:MAG: glycosyltransferase [Saprospiraceae bacterium]|nr:glycosyltransferase [Saprospiraceae bacterium]
MKKKILLTTSQLGTGGAERVFFLLLENLSVQKFDIICALKDSLKFQVELRKDVKLIEFKTKGFISGIYHLWKTIYSEKPDVVIGAVTPHNLYLILLKLFDFNKNRKYIIRETTVLSSYFQSSTGYKKNIIKLFFKIFYRIIDRVICQCEDIKVDFETNFFVKPQKLIIINNPIIRTNMDFSVRAKNKTYNLLTIGRLRFEKGYDRLLRILAICKNVHNLEFVYHIVGDGNLKEKNLLLTLINNYGLKENVILHGHVPDPKMSFAFCDLYLQGSYFEGFPNSLLEIISVGVPGLAFNVPGGTKDILIHNKNGYLVENNKEEEFIDYILKPNLDSFNKEEIAAEINNRFALEKIILNYETLFTNL